MRAVRIHARGGLDVVRLDQVPRPSPGEGQVLIQVAVAGVNRADLDQRDGSGATLRPLPVTLGSEVAGRITAIGPGVTGLTEGGRVIAIVQGGYADYAVAGAADVIPVPDGIGLREAAAITIQGVAADLLLTTAGRLQAGETALVHAAAGGVGSFAVQIARLRGAGRVLAIDLSQRKRALARQLGADVTLDPRDPSWAAQVRGVTGGRGVDVALDPIGGVTSLQTIGCLAPGGRLVVYGALSGQALQLTAHQLIPGNQAVVGFSLHAQPRARVRSAATWLFGHLLDGTLSVPISHAFPLEQAAMAQHVIEAGQSLGKVVLTVADA